MKLRIRGNSLRFRLGQDEVLALANGDYVEECVRFGPLPTEHFSYRVECSDTVEHIGLRYESGAIHLLLAEHLCRGWHGSDEVGFQADVEVEGGNRIAVLIEKDFACLQPRDPAEDAGSFPNPEVPC